MGSNKKGFDYYNTDTDRYSDIRIKKLKRNNGCAGVAVYDYILCEIYRVEGCFMRWDESTVFDVAEYFGLKESCVNEIVSYCCAAGLYDKELFINGNIITSPSIQRRFVDMCRRSKRIFISIPKKYCILQEEYIKTLEENGFTLEENGFTLEENNKVKKSKVNTNIPLTNSNELVSPSGEQTDPIQNQKQEEPKKRKPQKKPEYKTLGGFAREAFEKFYQEKFDLVYTWSAKDGKLMGDILNAIRRQREAKKMKTDDDSILSALKYMLKNIDDPFVLDHMDVSVIASKVNIILNQIKTKHAEKNNENRPKVIA